MIVKNHGISDEVFGNVLDAMKQFFSLPEDTKMKVRLESTIWSLLVQDLSTRSSTTNFTASKATPLA
jgi:isopenicillin N synthase-like dioxygenase